MKKKFSTTVNVYQKSYTIYRVCWISVKNCLLSMTIYFLWSFLLEFFFIMILFFKSVSTEVKMWTQSSHYVCYKMWTIFFLDFSTSWLYKACTYLKIRSGLLKITRAVLKLFRYRNSSTTSWQLMKISVFVQHYLINNLL